MQESPTAFLVLGYKVYDSRMTDNICRPDKTGLHSADTILLYISETQNKKSRGKVNIFSPSKVAFSEGQVLSSYFITVPTSISIVIGVSVKNNRKYFIGKRWEAVDDKEFLCYSKHTRLI